MVESKMDRLVIKLKNNTELHSLDNVKLKDVRELWYYGNNYIIGLTGTGLIHKNVKYSSISFRGKQVDTLAKLYGMKVHGDSYIFLEVEENGKAKVFYSTLKQQGIRT